MTVERYGIDYTRAVLPPHSSEETVTNTESSSFSYQVLSPEASQSLRHDFVDKYANFVWGPDLGLAAALILASPMFTLVDCCPIQRRESCIPRPTIGPDLLQNQPAVNASQLIDHVRG